MAGKPPFVGEKVKLGNLAEYVRGVTYKAGQDLSPEAAEGYLTLLRANNIKDGKLVFDDVQYVNRKKVKPEQILKKGDLLVCASSGSKHLVGKAAFVQEERDYTFGAFCCAIRSKNIAPEYLAHFFNSAAYRHAIEKASSGSNINNLKASNFQELLIAVYGSRTNGIIAELDRIITCIDIGNKQIELLDQLIKSRFVEMFGDPNEGEYKYEPEAISALCESFVGGGTPSMKHPEYYGGTIPFIKSGDLKYRAIAEGSLTLTEEGLKNSSTKLLPTNSVMVVTRSGILKHTLPVAINTCPVAINQDIKALILKETALAKYVQYALLVSEPHFLSKVRATTADNIETRMLKEFTIPLPPIEIQQGFVDFVAQVDKSRFVGIEH